MRAGLCGILCRMHHASVAAAALHAMGGSMAHVAWGRGGLMEEGLFGSEYIGKDSLEVPNRKAVKRSVQRNRDQRCRKCLLIAQSKSGQKDDPCANEAGKRSSSRLLNPGIAY